MTIPPILMQQGSGSWQAPLTSFPTSMVVPIGNFHPSAELNELSELRKRLDEEMRLRKDLCIQNSREVTGLRGDNKVIKQKTKILEQDLSAERKKRKEREATLDKVREEKWYAVNEVKEKLGELEKEQQRRKLAETTLENIKVELVKERERRKSVEKVLKELEGGKATEVALYYKKLEKDERLRKAREKREEYLRKEKLKEKEREKREKELEDGKAIEVALDYEKPEKEFGEEWEDDHFPQGPSDCPAELKVISAGATLHPWGRKGTGVERRASKLANEYRASLAKYDRQFHGVREGEVGPLVRRLQSYGKLEGLVVGPWGNGSRDLHDLVRTLAEEEGARAAAGRRQQALLEEERRRRDRVAHYQAHIRGRGVPWAGEIFHRH